MNKDILNVVRFARGEGGNQLPELIKKSKKRFSQMDFFVGSKWSNQSWSYMHPKQNIYFSYAKNDEKRVPLPTELEVLAKVFMVDSLWAKRLRNEPYSFSVIRDYALPLKILAEMGVKALSEIQQDIYDRTIMFLLERYDEAEGPGRALNRFIKFINENYLVDALIDTKNIRKTLGKVDEHGRKQVVKDKMPMPELVRAIIHLKWSVEDNYDGSCRSQTDKLSVLTQAFQYGLALRVGEVLRLPVNPLIKKDGEMFCLVWTEKGSMPMARYVPKIWRPLLSDAVKQIQVVSAPYRELAKELEETKKLTIIDERIKQHIESKERDCQKMLAKLDSYLIESRQEAEVFWKLKIEIRDDELVSIYDISEILPVKSAGQNLSDLLKRFKVWGLDVISKRTGKLKHTHWVTGTALKTFVKRMIEG